MKWKKEEVEGECKRREEEGGYIYFCHSSATVHILYYSVWRISGQTRSRIWIPDLDVAKTGTGTGSGLAG